MILEKRIRDYINALEADLPPILEELEQEALFAAVPIIRKETQTLLRFLLHLQRPKAILELGTAVGFSALFMNEYMEEKSKLVTVEKVEQRICAAKENFKKAKKRNSICLLKGDVSLVLQELNGMQTGGILEFFYPGEEFFLPSCYDFIFLDAAKAQYLSYLPQIEKLLTADGMLVTDNVLQDGLVVQSRYAVTRRDRTVHSRMREYLYTITHSESLETVVLPVGDGVALSRKKGEKCEREEKAGAVDAGR